MAVKIRLKRMGKKKQPVYRVVVADSRKARDGSYIDAIGFYDPRQEPSVVEVENDKAVDWLTKGAQPTEAARKLLEISGAWTQFKIARGEVLTVGADSGTDTVEEDAEVEEAVVAEEPTTESVEADVADEDAESADEPVAEAADVDEESDETDAEAADDEVN